MANNENLRPVRTKSEARERGKKGGKKSGEVRRRNANFRKTLNMLLTGEVDSKEYGPILEALGVESTLESAMLMSMIKAALEGNVKAAYFVAQYAGQSDKSDADEEEQRIRTDRARRARDQETGDETRAEENIKNFLKAVNPTKEDLDVLFDESVDVEDGEETEEAGEI